MEYKIIALCVIGLTVCIIAGINLLSDWTSHLWMVNKHCPYPCRYGSYKQFIENMNNHKWERDIQFPTSFFNPRPNVDEVESYEEYVKLCLSKSNYVHASIFIFDEVGMKLNLIEYIKVLLWLNKNKYTGN